MSKIVDLADGLPTAITKANEGVDLLRSLLMDLQNLREDAPVSQELRSSGLPFCPIKRLFLDSNEESYKKDHYVRLGTAIHEIIQHWAPKGVTRDNIFGNWRCQSCDKLIKLSMYPKEKCCKKHTHWEYEEVELVYKTLTAHVDLILRSSTKPYRYWVVDFKTADIHTKRQRSSWSPDAPSSRNYIVQIRTYCTLLQLQHDLNIVGWILPSVNRAVPITNSTDFHPLEGIWNDRYAKAWIKKLDDAVADYEDFKKFKAAVDNGDTKKSNKLLNRMIEYRPCVSNESYDGLMHFAFYGEEVCKLKKHCVSGKDSLVRKAIDKMFLEGEA